MSKTLGLDLGSNSIGWSIFDQDASRLVAAGVRVFPEGVDRDKQGGEVSKNEARRIARGMRRQIFRRANRKRKLCRILVDAGLLPREDVAEVLQLDPYDLRRRALAEKLEPFQIGRAVAHLNQRRGFLSNRKSDKAKEKETKGMLAEISQLQGAVEAAGHKTLGQYLAGLNDQAPSLRVRGRHTRRDMYETEFEAIWAAQQVHYPQLLNDELRSKVHHAIFFQRPLRIPKAMIGTCELETGRRRCPRADRRAQRFRMLQEVNNLRLIDAGGEERSLAPEERSKLIAFLAQYDKRTFDQIREHLGFLETVRFNFERAERKSLAGMPTDKMLSHKDLFGKEWYDRPEEEKNRIVRALLEEEEPVVLQRAVSEWGLSAEQAERLLDADLQPAGYFSYCREAIATLLPHLEAGLPLMTDDNTPCAITMAGYLRPDQREIPRLERLPQPPDLPNPIVRQALHEVRKVVNAIVKEFGRPDRIHIEMAREVKGSLEERKRRLWDNKEREARRDQAAERIREANFKPTREGISRYLLWEEQGGMCIYSGRMISQAQLLGGEADVDHILPKARSLDDSMANKVVCFRSENDKKSDRTPYEWLAGSDPARYEQVCQRARKLGYGKYRKFLQKNVELDDFIHRQLTDTAYIAKAVRQYLQCLVAQPGDILCTKGQLTAELRQAWGLNTILRDDGLNLKNREDHRHHAVDAIVIALTDRSVLQYLAREGAVPPSRPEFRDEVAAVINSINVSHRVQRGIAGALHEETIYGPTEKPGHFAYRKPLESLTPNEVENIRDPEVRAKVLARLKKFGVEPGRGKARIPAEAWKEPLWMNEEKKVPIHKVRLVKRDLTIQPIRNGTAFVKPGSLHHLCIFLLPDGTREAVFVTMIEAARRAAMGAPIIRRTHPECEGAEFVMSLSRGEMVLANWKGQERILRFRTAASTQGQIYFVDPLDARPSSEQQSFVAGANTLRARKVTVDPLGRIRWAHD